MYEANMYLLKGFNLEGKMAVMALDHLCSLLVFIIFLGPSPLTITYWEDDNEQIN